jgi:putative ABC transport system permease protein
METLLQDLRYGVRQLRKNPGFTLIAVLTLALGIAINATMFSMVSAILLRRPPGRDPERVVVVTSVDPAGGFQPDMRAVSAANYLAWQNDNHVFADIAAANEYRTANLTLQGQSEALAAAAVSPNFFGVLGVTSQIGRTFEANDGQPGQDHEVILSHELWVRSFGSDESVIGHTVRLNRQPYTVIGVMPASFRLLGFTPQLWTPLVLTAADQVTAARKDRSLYLFGRLNSGVSLEQARAEMTTLGQRAQQSFPETDKGWGVAVRTLPDFLIYGFGIRSGLAIVMTTVAFVLIIACANVAGLLLARAAGRRKEVAIRGALGAGRFRIVRQLLTEGLLIAILGGSLGLILSNWGIRLLRAGLSFNEAISAVPLGLDWMVVLFTAGISLVCAVMCGLAPALNASRTDITTSLKDESRAASQSRSRSRLRSVLVTVEIAIALFMLVGTGLLFRGIYVLEHQNLGFRTDHLLTAGVTLDSARYDNDSKQILFVRDVISRLQHLPGAEAAAVTSDLPASGNSPVTLHIKGQAESATGQGPIALDFVVTPDYLRDAGIALLHGRSLTETDITTAPRVVLVNQEFVHRYLSGQDPLAAQIRLDGSGASPQWSEIVGVVGNVKSYSGSDREDPEVYESFFQRPVASFSIMLRSVSDPGSLGSALRASVAQVDPELPLAQVMSMPAVLDRQNGGDQLFSRMLGTFALLALILAAIGIYGLIAYSVGQRSHEIGIRIALGAKSGDVLRMVLGEGMKMAVVGGMVGLLLSLPLPKLFGAMFFDLHVSEPRLYVIVPAAVLLVAVLATYIPARRAARLDPMSALRQE